MGQGIRIWVRAHQVKHTAILGITLSHNVSLLVLANPYKPLNDVVLKKDYLGDLFLVWRSLYFGELNSVRNSDDVP